MFVTILLSLSLSPSLQFSVKEFSLLNSKGRNLFVDVFYDFSSLIRKIDIRKLLEWNESNLSETFTVKEGERETQMKRERERERITHVAKRERGRELLFFSLALTSCFEDQMRRRVMEREGERRRGSKLNWKVLEPNYKQVWSNDRHKLFSLSLSPSLFLQLKKSTCVLRWCQFLVHLFLFLSLSFSGFCWI